MGVLRFKLIRNTGQFSNYSSGRNPGLLHGKLTLIYGENGLGKTTLTAILRSLGSGDPLPILERKRLGTNEPPSVVIQVHDAPDVIFSGEGWSRRAGEILVFDDVFVNQNVHSGLSVSLGQRRNLHGFILGRDGVELANQIDDLSHKISETQHQLSLVTDRVLGRAPHGYSADDFCSLAKFPGLSAVLAEAELRLRSLEQSALIEATSLLEPVGIPLLGLPAIEAVLRASPVDLMNPRFEAAERHLERLDVQGPAWVSKGVQLRELVEGCPFCGQDLAASSIGSAFVDYFGADSLRRHAMQISAQRNRLLSGLHGDMLALFQRRLTRAMERRRVWHSFIEIQGTPPDLERVADVWVGARDALTAALDRKLAAPLKSVALTDEEKAAAKAYEDLADAITDFSREMIAANVRVQHLKATTARGSIDAATSDVQRLRAIQERHSQSSAQLCAAYLANKEANEELLRRQRVYRDRLALHRDAIVPTYESSINQRLQRFNAGFGIVGIEANSAEGVPASTYQLTINGVRVPMFSDGLTGQPSFKNTLSSGDRNALALSLFFARLDADPDLTETVLVIDDPITSLDDARALVLAQEIRALVPRTQQTIVLSHSKAFLCALWAGASSNETAALRVRKRDHSVIEPWDVAEAALTEYDRAHSLIRNYVAGAYEGTNVLPVAQALRPVLEGYLRITCPEFFPPGSMLGGFLDSVRYSQPAVLSPAQLDELQNLKEYANRFHHEDGLVDVAWLNEQQLRGYARRVLDFVRPR